jgi:hypothetical protein
MRNVIREKCKLHYEFHIGRDRTTADNLGLTGATLWSLESLWTRIATHIIRCTIWGAYVRSQNGSAKQERYVFMPDVL